MKKKSNEHAVSAQVVLSSIKKEQGKNFKTLASIKKITKNNLDVAGAAVKQLKDARIMAQQKEQSIVGPILNSVKEIHELFKPFYDDVEEAETRIKQGIKAFVQGNKQKQRALEEEVESGKLNNISTYTKKAAELDIDSDYVSVRNVWKAFIVDQNQIPRSFMTPDVKKITEHLRKGGKAIPGVEWKQDESIGI